METNTIFTVGIWNVKNEKINQFIDEWAIFAKWSAQHFPGNGTGYLLQDPVQPQKFISCGSWKDEDVIQLWRGSAEFKNFVSRIKDLCNDFQPNTLKLVATSD